MKQVSFYPIRRLRVFSACSLSLLMLLAPMAPMAASVNRIAAAHAEKRAAHKLAQSVKEQMPPQQALERALFVNPPAPVAPNITATLSDSFVDTAPADGRADPSSVVTYTAVISNAGPDPATGVSFSDTIDSNTTLVGGSLKISPLAFPESYNTSQNTQLVIAAGAGVLVNDTGTPAPTVAGIATPACADVITPFVCTTTQNGTISLNADGSFTYDPPAGFQGTDSFTYTATNGQLPNDSATVTITVGPPNAPPVANDDAAAATEKGGINNGSGGADPGGNLITGGGGAVADTDPEAGALTVVAVHFGPEGGPGAAGTVGAPFAGTYGSLTLNADGSYTYTVDNTNTSVQALRTSGQSLQDVFNYTIQDPGGLQDIASFTITIAGANDNPVAVADTAAATEASGTNNGTLGSDGSGNVLTNDTDVDANGETKTVQGVAVGNQAGPLTSNVGVGLSGVAPFDYGTLTINADGSFTYVVNNANATVQALKPGDTQTDTFSYTMKDAANATSTTTVTITINGADDDPTAVDDPTATVNEDAGATAVDVLTNDTDVDTGPKNIASFTTPTANGGTVVGTGPVGAYTGLTYQPAANYCNHSPGAAFDTFTYTLNGGSTATVSMTVTCVNDPPVNSVPGPQIVDDNATLTFSSGTANQISVNDIDAGAGNLQVTVSVPVGKGTFVEAAGSGAGIVGSGTRSLVITGTLAQVNAALNGMVYTPPTGLTQAIILTVDTNDQGNTGSGGPQTASNTVTINVNAPPAAVADPYQTPQNTPLTVPAATGVLNNDTVNTATIVSYGTPNGNEQTTIGNPTLTSGGGSVTMNANGDGGFTYTPLAGFTGPDTFKYTLTNARGSSTATVTITVTAPNTPPTITDSKPAGVTMSEDGSPTPFSLTLHATDVDGDTLTWSISSPASHGTATASGTGTSKAIGYTPTANYNSSDSFTVQVSDGHGGTDTIVVNVTINPVNDAPTITDTKPAAVTMSEDGSPTPFSLTLNATDVDLDTLTWSISSPASHGTATASGTGTSKSIGYAPTANYFGGDSFTVQVSDGNGGTDTIIVNVTISAVNDAPTITDSKPAAVTMSEDSSPTAFSLTLHATDVESDTLTWSISSPASNGTATASGTGASKVIAYTPNSNYNGSDSFTVQVSDGNGGTDTIIVNVTINPVNDAPVVDLNGVAVGVNVSGSFTEDTPGGAVLAGSTDVTDIDNANLASATITLTNRLDGDGVESLSADVTGTSITANYTAATGVLALSGSDTLAHYQQVLRTVKYNNTSQSPTTTNRTVNFKVNDGAVDSATAVATVTVVSVNDAPILTNPSSVNATEDTQFSFTAGNTIGVTDADSAAGANFQATLSVTSGKINVTGAGVTGNNTSSVTITGTVANVNTILGTVKYTGNLNFNGTDTLVVSVTDNGQTGSGPVGTDSKNITINVAAVNDVPLVTPPAAFSAVANTKVTGLTGLLASVDDNADNGVNGCTSTPFTVTSGSISATSPSGGVISNVNFTTGTFDFEPPPGVTGVVTFTYTVTDSGCPGTAVSAPATVTINVSGPVIWFVDSTAPGGGNGTWTGTNAKAFQTVAEADAVDGVNHRIFVINNSGSSINYANGVALNTGEWLVGQGVTGGNFDSVMGIVYPGGTVARPAVNGVRPTLQNTVTLNTQTDASHPVKVLGLNLSTGANAALNDAAAAVAGVTVNEVAVTTTTGAGVTLSNVAGTFTFDGLTTNGGSGANLSGANTGATFSFTAVNITSSGANPGFIASGGGTINITGANNTITTTSTAHAFDITGTSGTHFGGSQTFKSINKSGATDKGIVVDFSDGSFTVTGDGADVDTLPDSATSGGTITGTTARGAEFVSVAGGVSLGGMTFTNATTVDAGSATVCGVDLINNDNTPCNAPIHLQTIGTSTTLRTITVNGSAQTGINGFDVRALSMNTVSVTNAGNAVNEHGVVFKNLRGTNTITASTFSSNHSRQLYVINTIDDSPNPTPTLSITSSTFSNSVDLQGALFDSYNSGNIIVNVGDDTVGGANTFSNNFSNALQQSVGLGGDMTINIKRNTFNHKVSGIVLQAAGVGATSNLNYTIWNNTVLKTDLQTNTGSGAIIVSGTQQHQISGDIRSNTIGNGTAGSGAFCGGGCNGITVDSNDISAGGGGRHDVTIVGNTVRNVDSSGIRVVIGQKSKGNVVITGNLVRDPDNAPATTFAAIYAQGGIDASSTSCLAATIGGTVNPGSWPSTTANAMNQIIGGWDPSGFQSEIFIWRKGGTFNIPGLVGSTNADVVTFVSARNNISDATGADVTASGGPFGSGASCPLMLAEGGVMAALRAPSLLTAYFETAFSMAMEEPSAKLSSALANDSISTSLNQQQLDSIVATAIDRWTATGLTQAQISTLRSLSFHVTDLDGVSLGEAGGGQIQIDRHAGGKGWFTGADLASDLLFSRSVSNTRRYTDPMSAPAGHLDLLTAIEHEMGHKLGLGDSYAEKDRDSLMYGYLTVGERRLPAPGQAKSATISNNQGTQHLSLRAGASAKSRRAATPARRSVKPITPLAGETVIANIGTLPAGKSVTITFQVVLNTVMPSGTSQVVTQGTVTYNGGNPIVNADFANPGLGTDASVLTDDPGTVAVGDATITPIDAPTASDSGVGGRILDSNGNPVEGAAVRMTGTQNRLTVTDAAGNYHFDDVETNGFYTVVPSRANFSFSPSQRAFSQLGQHTDAIFSAAWTGGGLNPLDTTEYFVRQQYLDFLNREPDESGLGFWVNNIESCGNDANCRAVKRTDTSAAFFLSVEFQQTGYLVYRTYQAAFGDLPGASVPIRLGEFKPDAAEIGNGVIVNQSGWDTVLENNKQAFAAEFVQRPRFASVYPTSMTPSEFVDKLLTNAGVRAGDTDRAAAISEFGSATTTADVRARGRALRRVAENSTLAQQEFTQAFVLMEYFGYLRRDANSRPDTDFSGYNFWLDKLNAFGGNYQNAEMVKAFLVSGEYRGRFPR